MRFHPGCSVCLYVDGVVQEVEGLVDGGTFERNKRHR